LQQVAQKRHLAAFANKADFFIDKKSAIKFPYVTTFRSHIVVKYLAYLKVKLAKNLSLTVQCSSKHFAAN